MNQKADLLELYVNYLISPHQVDDFFYYTFFTFHLVLMCIAFYFFYKKIKIARVLIDTPTSKIRAAAQGFVEIKGRCRQIAPLFSPLSNTSCTWYKYKVEQLKSSGNNQRWQIIEEGTSTVGFYLFDVTGECMVHPDGALIYPHRKKCWYGDNARPIHGLTSNFSFMKSYRYTEEVLINEMPIFSQGMYHTFRPRAPELDFSHVMSEWKRDYKNLLKKYDTNGNGELDPQEWQCVIMDAEKELAGRQAKLLEEHDAPSSINILSNDGLGRDQKFILSGKPELELYLHKRRVAIAYSAVFVLFAVHTLYALS